MDFSEAEMQVLASMHVCEEQGRPTDEATLRDRGEIYWIYLEDWSSAFPSLTAKGLIEGNPASYRLTEEGRPHAQDCHRARPDHYRYYYEAFYPAAHASAAHSQLCERVFGKDLCQDGQVDMTALHDLLARLDLSPEDHVLDLGCGAGAIAQYISDHSGAKVTGLEYAAPAVAEANARIAGKESRVNFLQGDMNALEFPAQSFDAVVSIDTLYWAAELTDTLSRLVEMLKPGGQIGIFIAQNLRDGGPPERLEADKTDVAQALKKLGLPYEVHDYSAQNTDFWQRVWRASTDLRQDYEAEGNGFIAAALIRESEEEFLPALEAGTITRYLYHVRL